MEAKPQESATSVASTTNDSTSIKPLPEDKNRFELELEFLQSLASPAYLHYLATQGYYQDKQFLKFLNYLKYWKRPEYAKYITYPHCLYFLDLLCENETFRKELVHVPFRDFVHQQQFYNWQYRSRVLYGTEEMKQDDENKDSSTANGEEKQVDG
ncbi:SOH1-domain-containing protein [Chaetoceros tenuissimus]|uniref:Mediator of RNA polymerase II transcription subunit 31 n=1 Tax=Chaetoceros tenuissimus TaxID=426638 RepID=A0AAD3CF17_9STRA|nr:SOH1-domain-containing protein [Chaetoceros tenuissimus]